MTDIPKINTEINKIKMNTDSISPTSDITIPQIEIQNNTAEEVNLTPNNSIDFSKIATSRDNALNGIFIDENKIHTEYWNPDELTFKENENGIITIYKGETIMGFTVSQNFPIKNEETTTSQNVEPIEVLEDTSISDIQNTDNLNIDASRNFEGVSLSYNDIYNVSDNPLTRSKGVVDFNNHKETYYSQKVLPGGGLDIPGRHVAADGTIRDELGYICVSVNKDYFPKGTTIMTSLGPGKVYDEAEAPVGIVDIYVDW